MKTVTITQLLNQYLKKIKGKPNRLGEERQKALQKKKTQQFSGQGLGFNWSNPQEFSTLLSRRQAINLLFPEKTYV